MPWTGGPCPDTGGKKILARIRCRSRAEVERTQQPAMPESWKNWQHTGGPGDIIEIKEIS